MGDVLNDLITTLPGSERYSYVFEGNSQTLDHILFSDSLFSGLFEFDSVHVNAEFATQASDHDPQVVRSTLWTWGGFQSPIDPPGTLNSAKAGSVVPVKFSLDGDQGPDVLADGYPKAVPIDCDPSEPTDALEEVAASSQSGLHYDALTDTYVYAWKTSKSWAGTCRELVVKLDDGSVHTADFMFVK
jgi:hypothetical protein